MSNTAEKIKEFCEYANSISEPKGWVTNLIIGYSAKNADFALMVEIFGDLGHTLVLFKAGNDLDALLDEFIASFNDEEAFAYKTFIERLDIKDPNSCKYIRNKDFLSNYGID